MDSQALQELWARPLVHTYRIMLKNGKYTLDAYLHGLFVGYYDRFHRSLGAPENIRDLESVVAWKRRGLAVSNFYSFHLSLNVLITLQKLALLMYRMHIEHSTATKHSLPASEPLQPSHIPNPSQQDLQSHDKPLEGPSSPEPLVSSSHHDADDAEKVSPKLATSLTQPFTDY